MAPIFLSEQKIHLPFLNNKLSLIKKINKKSSTVWKKMAKNSPKPYNDTTSNVFFYPKMAKTAKTRIFLDTALPLNDSKQLPQVSDQVLDKLCGFKENVQKPDPKTAGKNFGNF